MFVIEFNQCRKVQNFKIPPSNPTTQKQLSLTLDKHFRYLSMSVYEYIEIALQKCDHTICAILKSEVFSFTLTEQKY